MYSRYVAYIVFFFLYYGYSTFLLNQDSASRDKPLKKEKKTRSQNAKGKSKSTTEATQDTKQNGVRVEHLNYKVWKQTIQVNILSHIPLLKRVVPGMKILCQIVAIYPLMLIVSLPNQLLGHIPITHISSQLTNALEAAELSEPEDDTEEDEARGAYIPPDLIELFAPGQYIRAVVTAVKPPGTTEGSMFSYSRDGVEKSSRRVELSLIPDQVNAGLVKSDLTKGFVSISTCQ